MRETLQACCLIGLVFASPAVAQNAARILQENGPCPPMPTAH